MYRERLKLIHACIFFAKNCVNVGRLKLYKLLFILDFESFAALGRPVTGSEYQAWKMGPVPFRLHEETKEGLRPDMAAHLAPLRATRRYEFEGDDIKEYNTEILEPRRDFEAGYFSPFELELLTSIAKRYFASTGTEMSRETHAAFGYWDEIWNQRNQKNGLIPYELVFERRASPDDLEMLEYSKQRRRFADLSE